MKFRHHRGSLKESLETVVELGTKAELVAHLNQILDPHWLSITEADIEIKFYKYDDRIDWQTYLVRVRDWGPVGFTNSPL